MKLEQFTNDHFWDETSWKKYIGLETMTFLWDDIDQGVKEGLGQTKYYISSFLSFFLWQGFPLYPRMAQNLWQPSCPSLSNSRTLVVSHQSRLIDPLLVCFLDQRAAGFFCERQNIRVLQALPVTWFLPWLCICLCPSLTEAEKDTWAEGVDTKELTFRSGLQITDVNSYSRWHDFQASITKFTSHMPSLGQCESNPSLINTHTSVCDYIFLVITSL
jgi:hypothetical protein